MSRTYRPRLSKDKAVAQRVGEELERECLERFSVARQIAALKSLEESSNSQTSQPGETEGPPAAGVNNTAPIRLVARQAMAIAAAPVMDKSTPPSKRKRAAAPTATRRSSVSTGKGEHKATATSFPDEETRSTSARSPARTTRGVVVDSGAPHPCRTSIENRAKAYRADEHSSWSCPSCSFLNRESASQCSICSTRHYRPPSATRKRASSTKVVSSTANGEPGTRQRSRFSLRASKPGVRSTRSSCDENGESVALVEVLTGEDDSDGPTPGHSGCGDEGNQLVRGKCHLESGRQIAHSGTCEVPNSTRPPSSCNDVAPTLGTDACTYQSDGCALQVAARRHGLKRGRAPLHSSNSGSPSSSPIRGCSFPQRATPAFRKVGHDGGSPLVVADTRCHRDVQDDDATELTSALLVPETQEDIATDALDKQPPAATSSKGTGRALQISRKTASISRKEIDTTVVSPLTYDEKSAEIVAKRSKSVSRSDIGNATPGAEALALPSDASRASTWPTLVQAASLEFGGRSARWKVSSVIVTNTSDLRAPGTDAQRQQSGDGAGAEAAVIVCHSGGVSVWGLTDTAAVCSHLSPTLAGETTEKIRVRFHAVAVIGGRDGTARHTLGLLVGDPGRRYIVAVGRHEADPGPPVIRVWQWSWLRHAGKFGSAGNERKEGETSFTAAPTTLTTILKKKFAAFFPPMAPKDASPCLCVCNYSATKGQGEDGSKAATKNGVLCGKMAMVMSLGAKAVRLLCAPGTRGPEEIRAKSLPTGAVESTAIFTSLAPVPGNPSLVWASLPSSNVVLLWDTQELQLLFTLPMHATSICVPAIDLPLTLKMPRAGSNAPESSVLRRQAEVERSPSLLCLLATAGVELGDTNPGDSKRQEGCELFGICCDNEGDTGELGPQSCVVSAVRLGGHEPELVGTKRTTRRDEALEDRSFGKHSHCLSDGGGFVAGVDRKEGAIVGRNVLTGDTCVLVRIGPADDVQFSSLDIDKDVGVLAVAGGHSSGDGSTTVDLFVLNDDCRQTGRLVP